MILIILSFLSFTALAQTYETVVEDIVFNTSSRIILTEEAIRKSQASDVPSLLMTTANITVTSTPFQPTSLSVRGGDSGHVLILLDGIPFYDPSTIQRTGNLSALNIKTIKKIEVIKGSQSVLYGGQALSGVIKIETLSKKNLTEILAEVGTQNHLAGGIEYSKDHFMARGSHKERQSPSPRKASSKTYAQDQQNLDVGYNWQNSTEGYLKGSLLRDHGFSPSSDLNFNTIDVDNYELLSEQAFLSSQINFQELAWHPRLSLGLQAGKRSYDFPLSGLNPFPIQEDYQSHLHFLRLDLKPFQSGTLTIDSGLNYSFEDFLFKEFNTKKADNILEQRGLFTKITSLMDSDTILSYGARIEDWSHHDPVGVYQLGLSHKKTKLEVSTGYKTPSLYQLHSNFGNPELKEERGIQYSVNQNFGFGEGRNLSVTVFYARFSNLISTTGVFPAIQYVNINKTETRGAEFIYSQPWATDQSIIFNLGYQEPKDLILHKWLPRRPLANASVRYLFGHEALYGNAEVLAVGTRKDSGPNGDVEIPGYLIVNLGANLSIAKDEKIHLRIDNLGSTRYEQTYGYFNEGLAAVVGWSGDF